MSREHVHECFVPLHRFDDRVLVLVHQYLLILSAIARCLSRNLFVIFGSIVSLYCGARKKKEAGREYGTQTHRVFMRIQGLIVAPEKDYPLTIKGMRGGESAPTETPSPLPMAKKPRQAASSIWST
jgi:hypothetical protein